MSFVLSVAILSAVYLAVARLERMPSLRFLPGQAVLLVMGLSAAVVARVVAVAAIYGVSTHSNLGIELRWIEGLFVTPRLHRRHHVPSTTQHTFGAIFTIWDRCFGTLI